MAFLVPLFTFYGLLLISLGAGLAACAGVLISRHRRRWIWVAGVLAVLIGSWVSYQVIWVIAPGSTWFTVVCLTPIALGSVSLVRWFWLRA